LINIILFSTCLLTQFFIEIITHNSKQDEESLPSFITSPSNNTQVSQITEADLDETGNMLRPITSPSKCQMQEILDLVKTSNVHKNYSSKNLFYYFVTTCVVQVIGRTKWKENSMIHSYNKFIHATDESFALLVLENNCMRYEDMVERKSMKGCVIEPKFTTINIKGAKTLKRGWSDVGKIRFQYYTKLVLQYRNNEQWLNDKSKYIMKKCKKKYGKRKRDSNDDHQTETNKRMNQEEKDEWNNFLCENMNNKDWIANSVAI